MVVSVHSFLIRTSGIPRVWMATSSAWWRARTTSMYCLLLSQRHWSHVGSVPLDDSMRPSAPNRMATRLWQLEVHALSDTGFAHGSFMVDTCRYWCASCVAGSLAWRQSNQGLPFSFQHMSILLRAVCGKHLVVATCFVADRKMIVADVEVWYTIQYIAIIYKHMSSHIYIYIILKDQARLPKAARLEPIIAGNWSAWHLKSRKPQEGPLKPCLASVLTWHGVNSSSNDRWPARDASMFLGNTCPSGTSPVATDVWKEDGHGRCACVFSCPQDEKRCQHIY